jgi:hypothetical protein
MAARVTSRLWEMKDAIEMIEAWEAAKKLPSELRG